MYGLGDITQCGTNPCGFWDSIYASNACLAYKQCATPNDPATILESQGLIAGSGTVLGGTAGQAASNVIDALISETNIDPITGSITQGVNWTVLGIGTIVLYFLLKK